MWDKFATILGGCVMVSTAALAEKQAIELAVDEEVEIIYPSQTEMFARFGPIFGTPSWDAAHNCPKKEMKHGDPIVICGGLYDANGDVPYTYIESQFGGGLTFKPENGEIRLKLKNLSGQEMTFEVEIRDEM